MILNCKIILDCSFSASVHYREWQEGISILITGLSYFYFSFLLTHSYSSPHFWPFSLACAKWYWIMDVLFLIHNPIRGVVVTWLYFGLLREISNFLAYCFTDSLPYLEVINLVLFFNFDSFSHTEIISQAQQSIISTDARIITLHLRKKTFPI